ncbi:MAG TPA: protein kinase, partial [Gemmatimonadales bacterium]|nr:protein kinase [Gemmatimonadales bacterium]
EGQPLVADFGVALALSAAGGPRLTQSGLAVGTPLYMSPEQASGDRDVDRRTDVYSLAAVLYEMLAGEPPFSGATAAAVTAKKMLESAPSLRTVRDTVPGALDAVVRKAMARTPADRFATAQQFAEALELARTLSGAIPADQLTTVADGGPGGGRRLLPRTLAGAGLVAALAGTSWITARLTQNTDDPPPVTFRLAVEPLAVSVHGPAPALVFSPDGRLLAYVSGDGAGGQLYLDRLDNAPATPVPGATSAAGPFFSPDGTWIGYCDPSDWMIKKVPLAGGVPVELARAFECHGGAWGDGQIVFAAGDEKTGLVEIWGVPEDGGAARRLASPDSSSPWITYPSFLPDGQRVLVATMGQNTRAAHVDVLDTRTGEREPVLERGGWAQYVEPGYLVYAQDSALYGVRFDARTARTRGAPVRLRDDVMMNLPMEYGLGHFSISSTGTLAYLSGPSYVEMADGLAWADRRGQLTSLPQLGIPDGVTLGDMTGFTLSPNGRRILVNGVTRPTTGATDFPFGSDLFLHDLDRNALTRLSADNPSSWMAEWMPDGERMVQMMKEDSAPALNLFLRPVRGTAPATRLTAVPPARVAVTWSLPADGSRIFYYEHDGARGTADIWTVATAGGSGPERLLAKPDVNETDPAISPDGRWLAYVSNESGGDQVYLSDYPGLSRRWQVSTNGGAHPIWHPGGRELFFTQASFTQPFELWSMTLNPGEEPVETPRLLFRNPDLFTQLVFPSYDVAPDGSRFLVMRRRPVNRSTIAGLTVVVNWIGQLRSALP